MEANKHQEILQEMSNSLKSAKKVLIDRVDTSPEKDKIQGTIIIALVNSIYDGIMDIIDDELYQKNFGIILDHMGTEVASALLNIIIVGSINAAINAASTAADETFKIMDELSTAVESHLSNVSADLSAVKDSVVVLRKRIDDISKSKIINDISK